MTNEELIKGMICIRYLIEPFRESMPTQTETQLAVIDEIVEMLRNKEIDYVAKSN